MMKEKSGASWETSYTKKWDMSPETHKKNGEYFIADSYVEDEAGNIEDISYRKVSKEEYRAAKKQARRDRIELIRKSFRRRKDGEN